MLQDIESGAISYRPDDSIRSESALADLQAELAEKVRLIEAQTAELAHFRKLFERASAAARIGVWQCALPSEDLTWTDVVYDLFELPRGAPLDRRQILDLYPETSRLLLNRVRGEAIRNRTGFQLDVQIVTAKGAVRWIRITATVECEGGEPVRIFGMKQDITEERTLAERMRHMAEYDAMTGLANRARFQIRLAGFDNPADILAAGGSLMIVDLDGFKQVNDTFGHEVGDGCICEAAHTLQSVCAEAEMVARIGGDEFAVICRPQPRAAIEATARRLVAALQTTVSGRGTTLPIGASIGIAIAAGTGSTELFRRADHAMYAAKAAGRNTYRFADTAAASAA
ncbi:diguanylate cyclase domain-containing protein [Mongoliimonas terrestris]|uniref:diguanylate cyclase domain-containing protein n=1 Tax=Mongoliimonas terrestris TaxID=1709001 RepID=UPI000949AA9A|nr:diguanylate cyclase [Mongoliimonas terrestris]